ncbi:heterogeneous nuclear ribonucleoprotein Q-like [Arachis stenosperma]|uniref:heterogeneous nuclear ribonucleoprotein Q-like n=1 Tax=Arachis stenosperma TaxID=217475 RepID=UPI0025AB66AC|nr:heterogeneous nuclear ribonucleoprotein Q-like [Arachis stenosperma]XP_057751152.1 heterogeneous nuclear ribonucleoprotein Q-like [Arachis stenosperma]XP_057751153.1 heterogeneous nuclear ribonucleoprotein Q-like [Arachis stenosperma]XP_057751154.1 heterogeneous nuclear ribonucleoprotein Q-like [Arachis stenosperma]XP_057751155.1 heterogeneous nuclear ribonucleoprotein Q-like [Arachis stenosperma]
MPRGKANSSSVAKPSEPENPAESDEKIDFDDANDAEETMEEEIEYEEVEEEEEVEEIEEVEEEEEDPEEVEVVEEEEEEEDPEEVEVVEEEEEEEDPEEVEEVEEMEEDNSMQNSSKAEDKDEKKKHADLLSLPPHGSEVYIGDIPLDASTEDLKAFCESIGEVAEVRVMKGKDSSENKGFGFVTFKSVELASKTIKELNSKAFKGRKIKCSTAQAKHRLFIGNVPRNWGDEDLRKVVSDVAPGVTGLELVKDMKNTKNNRGFAFIDYYNHACAEYSRQKMMSSTFKLGDNAPTVSWAHPKNADSSASSQVRAVYVKNLPRNVTQEQMKKLFEHHGKITKVVLPPPKSGQEKNRIGFVHFAERSSAMKALKNTERYELEGQILNCSLAKPQADQKSGGSNLQKPGLLPSYSPHIGYGLVGALGAGYGSPGFAQMPSMYGRGAPAEISMMPMLLADGRIGYVLQQPGQGVHSRTPPFFQRGGWGGGGGSSSRNASSSSKGRHNNNSSQGHRYRPY